MTRLVPELVDVQAELSRRLAALHAALDGNPPGPTPAIALRLDIKRLADLTPLQRAAVKNTVEVFRRLDQGLRTLSECLLAITGASRAKLDPPVRGGAPAASRPDRESYVALARGAGGVLLASLFWILVDPPGHMAYVVFVGLFVLMGVLVPQMDWAQFFLVNMVGVVIAGLVYVLVMPSLTQFWELAAVMFLLVVFVTYISWNPRLVSLRLAGVIPFIMMTNLQNRQTYDFALFLNNCGAMAFGIVTVALVFHMPFGRRPERVFARLAARFFQRAEACMRGLASGDDKQRRRANADVVSLQALVGAIGGWASRIDFAEVTAATPLDVSRLVAGLSAVVSGLAMVAKPNPEDGAPWPGGERDMDALHAEILALLSALGAGFAPGVRGERPGEPAKGPPADTKAVPGPRPASRDEPTRDPAAKMGASTGRGDASPDKAARDAAEAFERRLEQTFQAVCAQAQGEEDCAFHRLLGGYRALRRALAGCAELRASFDWTRWNMARF